MNLSTIESTRPSQSRWSVQQALRRERNVEDEALAMGYRAAARGMALIRLSATVQAGGFFDDGLPRIAVARADVRTCFVRVEGWAPRMTLLFGDEPWPRNRGAAVGRRTVRVDVDPPAVVTNRVVGSDRVPTVRPATANGAAGPFHVLWRSRPVARTDADPACCAICGATCGPWPPRGI